MRPAAGRGSSPVRSTGEGDHAKRGGGGDPNHRCVWPPPPPPIGGPPPPLRRGGTRPAESRSPRIVVTGPLEESARRSFRARVGYPSRLEVAQHRRTPKSARRHRPPGGAVH